MNWLMNPLKLGKIVNPSNWVFENFTLGDEPFAKILQILEACVLVNDNLRGTLVSSLEMPTTFDEKFKVTSVPFFIPDINLLRLLKCYTDQSYINII